MRRLPTAIVVTVASLALAGGAAGHELDHPAPLVKANAPIGTGLNAGGPGANQRGS